MSVTHAFVSAVSIAPSPSSSVSASGAWQWTIVLSGQVFKRLPSALHDDRLRIVKQINAVGDGVLVWCPRPSKGDGAAELGFIPLHHFLERPVVHAGEAVHARVRRRFLYSLRQLRD